jgi:polysaccharide deacetylase family protein (PEP-CTERM system associated)
MNPCVFSVDVEDWFHILDLPNTPKVEEWPALHSDVVKNTRRMLAIFRQHDVKCTLFFLGWVAERWPDLVREAIDDGHEIASHGYAHELVYTISEERFYDDIRKGKDIIEKAGGVEVKGYRCPGFSVTIQTPWFFDRVRQAGYVYDSSVFPGSRSHGGLPNANPDPHVLTTAYGDLVEFPISLVSTFGKQMYFFGGGYLRFFPYWLMKRKVQQVINEKRLPVFYLHPREIDPGQMRLPMSAKRNFMTYVGLKSTEPKMHRLFNDFQFTTFAELLPTLQDLKG